MKKIILIYLLFFWNISFSQDSLFITNILKEYSGKNLISINVIDTVRFLDTNALKRISYTDSNNVLRKIVSFFPNGSQHLVKIRNKEGLTSLSVEWWPSGKLRVFSVGDNSDRHFVTYWYENGLLEKKFTRKGSCYIGVSQEWWANGFLKSIINYDLEEQKVFFYHDNGKIWLEGFKYYGYSWFGAFQEYSKNGVLKTKGSFADKSQLIGIQCNDSSKRKGIWIRYNDKGEELESIDYNKEGKPVIQFDLR